MYCFCYDTEANESKKKQKNSNQQQRIKSTVYPDKKQHSFTLDHQCWPLHEKYSNKSSDHHQNISNKQSIEMTERPKQNDIKKSNLKIKQIDFNGLPNFGSSCYLNSAIQLLYSASKVAQAIVGRSLQRPEFKLHNCLRIIFEDMEEGSSRQTKQDHLRDLLAILGTSNFKADKQNDCHECFTNILDRLQEQDKPDSKLKQEFKITSLNVCSNNCSIGVQTLKEYYLNLTSTINCPICLNKSITQQFQSFGPYLVILSQTQKTIPFQKNISKCLADNSQVLYQMRSFVTHFKKDNGHYICHRQTEQGWIKINDSTVQLIGKLNTFSTTPRITLYQRQKQAKTLGQ